ncbi:MAG: fibronectin type III domain-containing protein [Paludibacteraceae bacterium]|nr:fibronectin type III domain-containing protein [Paludibacteraceae bacterium]
MQATEVTIGDEESTTFSTYVPFYTLFNYGYSQQIFTADEIGTAGTINSLSMWMYYTGSLSSIDVSIYMVEVDDEEFATATAWVALSEDNLVYSGTLNKADLPTSSSNLEATTFELENPFSYSGTSNLLIAIANNTGDYSSGFNCRVDDAPENAYMSLYAYRDASAYDITNPNVSGTRLAKRNVITLDIVSGGATVIPCDKPSGITASDVTAHQATLAWADGSGVYNVEYKKASDEDWTPFLSATTLLTADLMNLEANTDYQARVQSVCADNQDNPTSSWKTVSFKTMIGLPFEENFDALSAFPSTDWKRYSGKLIDDVLSGTTTLGSAVSSGWTFSSSTTGVFESKHMYVNIWSTYKYWVVSPVLPMEDNVQLTFDMVLSKSSSAYTAITPGTQDDDKFVVLISTDSMATWTILRQWDNAGSEYVYDNIALEGEEVAIDLSAYNGENIQLAFYGASTASGGDNYLHIDNILVDYIPSCFKPTDLAVVANSVTSTSVELEWTANTSEDAWILQYKKSSEKAWQELIVTENPYTLENLDPYTNYDVQVAALCDALAEDGTSKYSKAISFKTAAVAPFAESFNLTSLPDDWTRYKVPLDDVLAADTVPTTPVSAGWLASSTSNGVFPAYDGHLKLQVYGDAVQHWIVSPFIEMDPTVNMQLTFDLALTKSSGSLQPAEAGEQADDKFAVLITTDGGESWEELYTRDNVSTEPTYDQINCSAEGEMVKIDLTDYAADKIAFAFYGESTVAGGSNYLHIANISIDTIPDCEKPLGLQGAGVTSSSASFMWDEAEGATWAYGFVVDTFTVTTFVPVDEDFTATTTENTATIDELQENTNYIFFVRRDCGGAYSEYITRRVRTLQTPATLPFEDDFEGAESWVLLNGDMTNNWVIGSATNNGGSKSLYVSDDHGVTNKYSHGATTIYATKTFEIEEEGKYNASYDWKGQGESTWDLVRVALAPADVELEAGTALPSGLSSTSGNALGSELPAGWISLDGGKLNLQANWQHNSVDADLTPGTYKVVIIWRNDGSTGTQTPAGAIDNFKFAQVLCVRPENVRLAEAADSISTNSALIDWDAQGSEANWLVQYKKTTDAEWTALTEPVTAHPFLLEGLQAASMYEVQVAAWCNPEDSATISDYSASFSFATECDVWSIAEKGAYTEGFEAYEGTTYAASGVAPACWNVGIDGGATVLPHVIGSGSYYYVHDGTKALTFHGKGNCYAALPEFADPLNTLQIKFWSAMESSSNGVLTLGYITDEDPGDFTTFHALTTFTNSYQTMVKHEAMLDTIPTEAHRLVFRWYYSGQYSCCIDDIEVSLIPDCFEPASIQVVEATTNSVKFTYTAAAEGDSLSYAVVLAGVEPTEFIGVTADTILVEGLAAGTEYELYLRTECATSHSVALSAAFQTKQLPIDLGDGFADDFEGANLWTLENGTLTNAWVLGTAAHNGEGSTKALYISNDGGAHNAYTITTAAVVYAMKPFNIAAGSYTFQYDWMAYGESSSDYLRVALVPASVDLAASTSLPTGVTSTALPEGLIAIDGGTKQNLSSAWATYTSDEIAVPAGTYNVVFMWRNDGSIGTQTPAAVDNFSITKVLCGKPTGLKIEKANITATSAIIEWTADEGQTEWILAMDTIASFNKDSDAIQTVVSANPYTVENLLPEHTYYVYVRANCGEGNFSAWSARASFKTAKSCQKPDGLEVASITDSSAVITWNTYGQSDFILTYGIGNAYADTVEVTGGTYTINGLDANTSYKVKVAAACDENTFSSAKTFKTACAPATTVVENFDGITGQTSSNVLPDCWSYLNGGSSYAYLPTAYASESYANSGTNSLKFYSDASTSYADQYAILPAVEGLNALRMKFNARKYSASYEGTLVVGIMTDPTDAATFVAIDTIRPAAITYEPFVVSFGEYTGEGLYAAFKLPVPATSYSGVHVDDVELEEIPSCLEPANLAVSEIGTDSAVLNWESTAAQWQLCLNGDTIEVNAKPYVLSNLTAATNYEVKVRAICAVGDTSAWSKSMTFATECELISLAAADYVEGFEAYQGSTYNDANGEVPVCWEAGTDGSVAPHVIGSGSYYWTHEGTKALTFYGSGNCFAIMPKFAEPLNTAQISFWAAMESATNGTLYLGYITEEDPNTFNPITTYDRTVAKEMAFYETSLDTLPASASQLVFLWSYTSQWSCCIDDITVSLIPECPKSTGLHADMIGDTLATFAWNAEEDVTWEYGLVLDTFTVTTFVPADADFTGTALVNEVTIDTLAPQTAYLFFMRKVCANGKSPILFQSFTTVMAATALPYDEDFENGNSWSLVNGTMTNAWTVGTAATENGNALYISNDGGTTFEYTVTSPVIVYAAKVFNFDKAGSYTVSYDWRANGESNYDYLRVAIVPATVELAAATSVPSGFSTTGLPTGWKAADGGSKLNLSNAWQNKSVVVENIVPGYYQLVFAWRNDNSTGTQNPAAVDNIHIQHLDYPTAIGGTDAEGVQAIKFIENDHVYILVNGVIYDLTGRKVK